MPLDSVELSCYRCILASSGEFLLKSMCCAAAWVVHVGTGPNVADRLRVTCGAAVEYVRIA